MHLNTVSSPPSFAWKNHVSSSLPIGIRRTMIYDSQMTMGCKQTEKASSVLACRLLPICSMTSLTHRFWHCQNGFYRHSAASKSVLRICLFMLLLLQQVNPKWLIWVQGTQGKSYPMQGHGNTDSCTGKWWGGETFSCFSNCTHCWGQDHKIASLPCRFQIVCLSASQEASQ